MPWTGGYPLNGNPEGLVIPTGYFGSIDTARRGVFVANVMVTAFVASPAVLAGGQVTFSCQANVRWRKRWVSDGSVLNPDNNKELVINASLVPVNVSDSIASITVTAVRWTVWRLT